mmetsp:Transcript_64390/g.172321  ORF Transcript_64390/g.172321 Transcript_64390/m.172321 type:complete len:108 (+) Transcript_64390:1-324(+)
MASKHSAHFKASKFSTMSKFLVFLAIVLSIGVCVLLHILVLSRMFVDAEPWNKRVSVVVPHARSARKLSACRGGVMAHTDYAIVSMFSGSFSLYGLSAMKLAETIRR